MYRSIVLAALVFATLISGSTQRANAGFMLSGYSTFTDRDPTEAGFQPNPPGVPGTLNGNGNAVVNFAVYENTTGNWLTDPTLSALSGATAMYSGPVDAAAQYVYLYEVVNTGSTSLSQLQVGISPSVVTSAGYVSATVFSDASGAVKATGNVFLGSATTASPMTGLTDEGGNYKPTVVNYPGSVAFTTLTGSVAPTGVAIGPNIPPNVYPDNDGSLVFYFVNPSFSPLIGLTKNSTLLFITSNFRPTISITSSVHDGVATYNEIPVPTPLPASLALFVSGIPGLLGVGMFLRRKQQVKTQA